MGKRVSFSGAFGRLRDSDIRRALLKAIRAKLPSKEEEMVRLLDACLANKEVFPDARSGETVDSYMVRWVARYERGYARRASISVGRLVSTVPDPAVNAIVEAALCGELGCAVPVNKIELIQEAHRLSMAAENVLGGLLEEYIADETRALGWVHCWGSTVRSVDFIGPELQLLQVKNRSNSENSSSMRVRLGTSIQKWHRINAATGATNWPALGKLLGDTRLDERGFQAFIRHALRSNPGLLQLAKSLLLFCKAA